MSQEREGGRGGWGGEGGGNWRAPQQGLSYAKTVILVMMHFMGPDVSSTLLLSSHSGI